MTLWTNNRKSMKFYKKLILMKKLNLYIITILLVSIIAFLSSCEKFEIKRVMDTQTGEIEINDTKVVANGTLLDIGDKDIVSYGHCWSLLPDPTIDNDTTNLGLLLERGEFSSELFGLIADTTHYVRSYIYDGKEYTYGDNVEFKITADSLDFTTFDYERIDESKISINSDVVGIGSLNFSNHGHCWSTNENPTITDNISSYGNILSDKDYTSKIINLNLGRYYIRAYLRNDDKVVYSNTIIFDSEISVNSGIVVLTGSREATAYGNILSLGAKQIQNYGHCWSLSTSMPTINDNKTELGTSNQLMSYNSKLKDLIVLDGSGNPVKYYVRAYAEDGDKVYYGNVVPFEPIH